MTAPSGGDVAVTLGIPAVAPGVRSASITASVPRIAPAHDAGRLRFISIPRPRRVAPHTGGSTKQVWCGSCAGGFVDSGKPSSGRRPSPTGVIRMGGRSPALAVLIVIAVIVPAIPAAFPVAAAGAPPVSPSSDPGPRPAYVPFTPNVRVNTVNLGYDHQAEPPMAINSPGR